MAKQLGTNNNTFNEFILNLKYMIRSRACFAFALNVIHFFSRILSFIYEFATGYTVTMVIN